MLTRFVRRMFLVSIALTTATRPGAGQSAANTDKASGWSALWRRPNGCLAALRPEDMTRELVYLDARMAPNSATAFNLQADLLAKEVNLELRKMLGGSEEVVPDAGAGVRWSAVPAELIVSAHSDGTMTWRGVSASGDSSATLLLSIALDSARRHGTALMLWPSDFVGDSLFFRLSLLPSGFLSAVGLDTTYKARMRFGAFTLPLPKLTPALPATSARIVYPHSMEFRHVTGFVVVEFIVDSAGRAEMSTFRDIWPTDKPRLTGQLGSYYSDFVSAIRSYTSTAKFTPARIGSCAIPQWVQFPVSFIRPRFQGAY